MVDLEKMQRIAERAVHINADKEQLFNANEVIAVFERLRQAEKDAARYRWLAKSSESWRPGGKGIIVAKVSENYERPTYSVVSDLGEFIDEAMQCK